MSSNEYEVQLSLTCTLYSLASGQENAGYLEGLPSKICVTRQTMLVGSGSDCDICLQFLGEKDVISRHHAYIRRLQSPGSSRDTGAYSPSNPTNEWYIYDLNSVSGTFVNGHRVSKMKLSAGDVLSFGSPLLVADGSGAQQTMGGTAPAVHYRVQLEPLGASTARSLNSTSPLLHLGLPTVRSLRSFTAQHKRSRPSCQDQRLLSHSGPRGPGSLSSTVNVEELRMGESLQTSLSSEASCPICWEILWHPMILGCSHSFCEPCIKEWMRQSLDCPKCRSAIRDLPIRNRALENVLQTLLSSSSGWLRRESQLKNREIKEAEECRQLVSKINEAKDAGHTFLNISDHWNSEERKIFRQGLMRFQNSARMVWCESVGLTPGFALAQPEPILQIAALNLGLLSAMRGFEGSSLRDRLKLFIYCC